jgi:3-hydroxyacyl-[acyl-carrier-protein] dehydratase
MIMTDANTTIPPRTLSFGSQVIQHMMPHRRQMALLDRVESYSVQDRKIVGIKEVGQNEPVFEGHFPDEPLFPGPLIIEALAQACGVIMNIEHVVEKNVPLDKLNDAEFIASVPPPPHTVLVESKVQLQRWVRPGEVIQLEAHLAIKRREICYFKVRALVDDTEVAKGEIILALPDYAPAPVRHTT